MIHVQCFYLQPLEQFNKARLLEEVTKYLKVEGKFIFGILIGPKQIVNNKIAVFLLGK